MINDLNSYFAYKNSGVPRLGDVPEHWEVRRLRYVTEMRVSNVDKHLKDSELPVRLCNYIDVYKNDRINDRISFMRATATPDEIARFLLKLGDVLITKDSEEWNDIGVPALVEYAAQDLICGYHLAILRPRKGLINGAYLLRILQSPGVAYQFHLSANGVTRYGLSHDSIKAALVPLPPLAEQSAIVRFLDHLDRRIRLYIRAKQKLIKLLEEQKQAIIHRAVSRGLDPNVRFKPSGVEWLGDVPHHWEVRKVGVVSKRITKGTTPTTLGRGFTDEGVRFVKVECISKTRRLLADLCTHIDAETDCLLARSRLRAGDVLVAIAGAIGRVALVHEDALPANCNQAVAIITPIMGSVLSDWLAFVLSSPACQRFLNDSSVQSAQANLSLADLRGTVIPVPPIPEQVRIVESLIERTAAIDCTTISAEHEISLLREYRTRLIADVVTGRIDVREVAAGLPDEADVLPESADEAGDAELDEAES